MTINLRSPQFWWASFVAWLLTVCVLSSIPGNEFRATDIPNADKIVHVAIFLTGAGLLTLALRTSTVWSSGKIAVITLVTLAAFAVADELHQTFTPHRSGADVGDLIADTAGTILGVIFALSTHAQLKKRHLRIAHLGTPSPDPAA